MHKVFGREYSHTHLAAPTHGIPLATSLHFNLNGANMSKIERLQPGHGVLVFLNGKKLLHACFTNLNGVLN